MKSSPAQPLLPGAEGGKERPCSEGKTSAIASDLKIRLEKRGSWKSPSTAPGGEGEKAVRTLAAIESTASIYLKAPAPAVGRNCASREVRERDLGRMSKNLPCAHQRKGLRPIGRCLDSLTIFATELELLLKDPREWVRRAQEGLPNGLETVRPLGFSQMQKGLRASAQGRSNTSDAELGHLTQKGKGTSRKKRSRGGARKKVPSGHKKRGPRRDG